MRVLQQIMNWYGTQCNEDWEHSFGIKIDTIDNPGWSVLIDLQETSLANKAFVELDIKRTEEDWLYCAVSNGKFNGAGGVGNLAELLCTFLEWEAL